MLSSGRSPRPSRLSPGDLVIAGVLAAGVILLTVGLLRRSGQPALVPAPGTSATESSSDLGSKRATTSADLILDPVALAPNILATLPVGTTVEDARLKWPGPDLIIRGHALSRPGVMEEFDAWRSVAAGGGWFRRLQKSTDDSLVIFEYCLEGKRPMDSAPVPAARARRNRLFYDPAWDSVLVSLSTDATRLSRLADRTAGRWTVGYRGRPLELLTMLQAVLDRRIPVQSAWLGPDGENPSAEWELLLKVGMNPGSR